MADRTKVASQLTENGDAIMDYLGGPNVITRAIKSERVRQKSSE